jgi:hypothetical protein
MNGPHRYTVHGLEIASELALPELRPSLDPAAAPDVVVRCASVPRHADDPDDRWFFVRGDGDAVVRIVGIATFVARGGVSIDVDAAPGADPAAVRVYLLGSALGVLLHQRGDLPLHVSAVVIGGRAWAFTAPAGTGKSTLAAALHLHAGLPLVTDDVGVVRPAPDGSGGAWLWPGPALLKLREDAFDGVRSVAPMALPEYAGSEKVRLAVPGDRMCGPVPLAGILHFVRGVRSGPEALRPVRATGAQAFLVAQASVYRLPHGAAATSVAQVFGRVAWLARTVPCFRGTVAETDTPASPERAAAAVRMIEQLEVAAVAAA